jgi:hypothetical protein
VPKVLKVSVLSDQITPLTLGTLSILAHFRHSSDNRPESEIVLNSLKLHHDIRSSEVIMAVKRKRGNLSTGGKCFKWLKFKKKWLR